MTNNNDKYCVLRAYFWLCVNLRKKKEIHFKNCVQIHLLMIYAENKIELFK